MTDLGSMTAGRERTPAESRARDAMKCHRAATCWSRGAGIEALPRRDLRRNPHVETVEDWASPTHVPSSGLAGAMAADRPALPVQTVRGSAPGVVLTLPVTIPIAGAPCARTARRMMGHLSGRTLVPAAALHGAAPPP